MQPSQPTRIGVIDLGSNTARLVVFAATPGHSFRLEDEIREVVRLRQGMSDEGLSPEAVERAFSTLSLFVRFCQSTAIDTIIATATSAVREAANGPAFIERVEAELGLTLRILAGDEEAYYGVIGALNEIPVSDGVVLDIGGGSAQVSEVLHNRFSQGQALTLGALALTERFVTTDPIGDGEFKAVQKEIARQLDQVPWLGKKKDVHLVGLGGTIRNLADLEIESGDYPLETLLGYALSRAAVDRIVDDLRRTPLADRRKMPGLSPDRADIILQGALVLQSLMHRLDAPALQVATSGLREGLFFEQFWQHLDYPVMPDVRRFSVLNAARIYRYQEPHANHVRFLCGRLFEELEELHGYGRAERELLEAAALLHDLGNAIGYHGHHKHSQTLINYHGLPGFSPREIAIVGLLARYHRKGRPDISAYKSLLKKKDQVLLERLAAILRLAEYLERGRNGAVTDLVLTITDEQLRLSLIAAVHPAVELWQAERHALDLMAKAFDREIHLSSLTAPTA